MFKWYFDLKRLKDLRATNVALRKKISEKEKKIEKLEHELWKAETRLKEANNIMMKMIEEKTSG